MLIPRQSQSCSTKSMAIVKPNITHMKRNVARKSTSNRPLKNRTNTFICNNDKTDSILSYSNSTTTCFKNTPLVNAKCNALNSEEVNLSDTDSNESHQHSINRNYSIFKTDSRVDSETYIYQEESEEDDDDIEGTFSISQGLGPFLSESNLSPSYLSDSSDELDSLTILNYPINAEFSGDIFKAVPYYSNQLADRSCLDTLDCDKSELPKCSLKTTFDSDHNENVVHKKGIKLVNNTVSVNNKTSEDSSDISENRLVGVSVREDYVICEDRRMKMTVIEAEEFDVRKFDNVTEDVNFHDDNVNDETDFPKVVCAVSLGPGSELEFEDILTQFVAEEKPQIVASKKTKPKKRKATSNLFFGSRSKKKTRRSKSNVPVNSDPNSEKDINSSQRFATAVDNKVIISDLNVQEASDKSLNFELEGQDKSDTSLNTKGHSHETCSPTNSSSVPNDPVQNISSNSDNVTISVESNLTEIKSEIHSADENEKPVETENSCDTKFSHDKCVVKEQQMESKKNNAVSCDKKSKKEINEGVLLHVEAAKETEIMRDGKILKDKKELLKDIESKIEKNIPVEVKDFDIQQSLTEEILLEQALRLAHQRTSPRRRPLLSKSETKAILSCLSNQTKYRTRKSNDKKTVNDLSSSKEKPKPDLDVSTVNSDSEVKNSNVNESSEKLSSINQKKKTPKNTSKSRKKPNAAAENIPLNKNNHNTEKLEMNTLAETFENVLRGFQSPNSSDEINLKEEKQQSKGANRKKKYSKKNKKKSLGKSDDPLPEPDIFYESAISQDSVNEDNLSTGNDECKNKRIPVIIIKNKKVTITDHKSKKRRYTNNIFSIIKNRECNDSASNETQLEESIPMGSSPPGDSLVNHDVDTSVVNDKNISNNISNKSDVIFDSKTCLKNSDSLNKSSDTSKINILCESQNSDIRKDLMCEIEQCKGESLKDNISIDNSLEKKGSALEINSSAFTEKSKSSETSDLSSEVMLIKHSEDIVEVVDMDIVDIDSPKPNAADSNSSQDQIVEKVVSKPLEESRKTCTIPFLEDNDLSQNVSNMEPSPDKPLKAINSICEEKYPENNSQKNDNIGQPIPTISEINAKHSLNIKPCFQSLTSSVKSNSSYQISLPNVDFRFISPPPPLPINVSSGFSSSPTSINSEIASGIHNSSLPQESISSLNSAFYPSFPPAASTSASNFNSSTTFMNSFVSTSYHQSVTTLTSSHLSNGTYLQNALHSTSDMLSYPPPLISSGISNTIQVPSSPVVQNTPLSISEMCTTRIQSSHSNISPNAQFSNYSYHLPNHNNDSKLNSALTYPASSKEMSSSDLKIDVTSPTVVQQENSVDKITPISMTTSEVKVQEKSLTSISAPVHEIEKPKTTDVPICIAARDPRLRKRNLQVIVNSHVISIITNVEKCENKLDIQTQSVEKTEDAQPAEDKSAGNSDIKTMDAKDEMKNETECDNEISKKKSKKKEIDQELLYKTPLSDLHDAPERTSYSRTLPRKPARIETRNDPRHFQRDINNEVPFDHHGQLEFHREYPHCTYSQPVGNAYHFGPESHSPDTHRPDSQRIEDYEQRNEPYTNDMRPDYYSSWRQGEFTQETNRPREYTDRRPLLETPGEHRRINYRHRESYSDVHIRSQDVRRQSTADYRRRGTDDSVYSRWDYAHKRMEGILPSEIPEAEKSYSSNVTEENWSHQELWEDENEIRDLIEGPMASASRPFFRRKRFTKPWKPAHQHDDDGSSSPYCDDLFERRRNLEMRREEGYNERTWERSRNRKCDDERVNAPDRECWDDRRYHRNARDSREGRSRSPRRDYEMYEKKRARSPRRRERNWGPGRGSVSPRTSPLDLESPMSPEPEETPYTDPPKYLPIPQ